MSSIFGDGIDTTKIEAPRNSFEPLAPGKYDVIITEWEKKATNAGTGHYLQLKMEVTSAHGCGRLLWVILNLDNPNPVAVEIAQRELKQLGDAVGITDFKAEDQLLNQSLSVKVAVDGERNRVKGYYKLGTQSPAAVATPAPATPAQPAAAATEQSKIPW